VAREFSAIRNAAQRPSRAAVAFAMPSERHTEKMVKAIAIARREV
jgi:hypothetical protein